MWMARPDLPQGYGGWQAIDATPQETSEGTVVVIVVKGLYVPSTAKVIWRRDLGFSVVTSELTTPGQGE